MRYTLSTMEMNLDNEAALVEAILFLESEPLAEKTIALIAELSEEVVQKALELLKNGGIDVKGTEKASTSLEDFYFGLIGGGEE